MSRTISGLDGLEPFLVDDSAAVKHTCGHLVFWSLFPGLPGKEWLAEVSKQPCPACGSEKGFLEHPAEWPCHVPFRSVGVAHCHPDWLPCKAVEDAYRQGLKIPDNQDRAKFMTDLLAQHKAKVRRDARQWFLDHVRSGRVR